MPTAIGIVIIIVSEMNAIAQARIRTIEIAGRIAAAERKVVVRCTPGKQNVAGKNNSAVGAD